jgi:transcriptional regulator with XRE-family HTH domain
VLVHVLRALRLWDKSDLAAAAGLDPAAITRYESGTSLPRVSTLERLAAAVGLPMGAVETVLLPVVRLLLALSVRRRAPEACWDSGAEGCRGTMASRHRPWKKELGGDRRVVPGVEARAARCYRYPQCCAPLGSPPQPALGTAPPGAQFCAPFGSMMQPFAGAAPPGAQYCTPFGLIVQPYAGAVLPG